MPSVRAQDLGGKSAEVERQGCRCRMLDQPMEAYSGSSKTSRATLNASPAVGTPQ